ncbi:sulfatase-like hydrolase/transferase [bacterium]|nr:sulfatase-like hydrolase/transferase [bacterium]
MFFAKRNILLLSAFLVIFLSVSGQITAFASSPKNSANILLITIDTLRPDHLGCYGNKDIKTPNIDNLARDGVLFANAYSPVPLTLPSHVSMMTGRYPIQHGIQNNGGFILEGTAKTLAEILRGSGYKTGAIVASYVLASHFGLSQGFDDYDDHFLQNTGEIKDYSENSENLRTAEDVTGIAGKWLNQNHKDPFFFWVHYFDPHAPYSPPPPFDATYKDNPYDGEIAYTDHFIGRLLEEIKKLSIMENTCIIIVGDHGEGLWEHNEQTHGLFIYDTTLRVPLIISHPKLFKKNKKVLSMVRTIDIMPTILESLCIQPKDTYIQGTSLVPLLKGEKKEISLDLYCESVYSKLNLNWSPLEGIVTADGWKYIHAPKPELYNLKKDPHEKKNLLSIDTQKAESLKKMYQDLKEELLVKSHSKEEAKSVSISAETRERLQSLGYIAFSGSTDEGSGDQPDLLLPDPKDKAHLLAKIDEARGLEEKEDFDKAIQKYEEVLKEDPDNKMALYSVGLRYISLGRPKEALISFQKITKIDPQNFDALNILGLIYDLLCMPDEAIKSFKTAIQINNKAEHIHYNLGNVYLKTNHLDMAEKKFQEMLSFTQDPVVISAALGNIGGIYVRQKHFKKAMEKFKESIKYNSINRDAHIGLADSYYSLGDIDNSINEWKNIIDIWPDDYVACYKLAQLSLDNSKTEQAIIYLKKSLQIRPDYMDARILLQNIYGGFKVN